MPARQPGDQFHLTHWCNDDVTIDDEGETQKKTNLANRPHVKHLYFRWRIEKPRSWILSWSVPQQTMGEIYWNWFFTVVNFSIRPDTRLIRLQNTVICRSCVQIQSHELRISLHFQPSMTKYCRRSQRYSKRHKTSFSPLLKRKTILLWSWRSQNPEMILVLPF